MDKIYAQGDILIVPDNSPIKGTALKPENGRTVLAHGEVTGHHHSIPCTDGTLFGTGVGNAEPKDLRLTVKRPTVLAHQEHAPINLPAGDYKVVQQTEYVAGELPRAVRD